MALFVTASAVTCNDSSYRENRGGKSGIQIYCVCMCALLSEVSAIGQTYFVDLVNQNSQAA